MIKTRLSRQSGKERLSTSMAMPGNHPENIGAQLKFRDGEHPSHCGVRRAGSSTALSLSSTCTLAHGTRHGWFPNLRRCARQATRRISSLVPSAVPRMSSLESSQTQSCGQCEYKYIVPIAVFAAVSFPNNQHHGLPKQRMARPWSQSWNIVLENARL